MRHRPKYYVVTEVNLFGDRTEIDFFKTKKEAQKVALDLREVDTEGSEFYVTPIVRPERKQHG